MRAGVMYESLNLRLEFDYITRHRSFEELRALATSAYAGAPRSTHTDEELWRAFPRGYVGCWVESRLRAAIQLWPLDGRRASDFLDGTRSEAGLGPGDLATVCNSEGVVWHFSGLVLEPDWRGRGMAAHLLAEAMVRWQRDLPFRTPVRFTALAASEEGIPFIHAFGMEQVVGADETADGFALYGRTFETEAAMLEVVRAARDVADRKGRLVENGG